MRTAIRKNLTDFLAILGVVVLGIGIGAYVLANQRLRFPLIEDAPYTVKAELPDAQAVTPGQGQTIVVAGVRVGDIGKVELEDGKAVVELQLEPKYRRLLRDDASALLRAKTGTKDMFLEVDPGDGKPLPDGGRIQVSNTLPDIDPDKGSTNDEKSHGRGRSCEHVDGLEQRPRKGDPGRRQNDADKNCKQDRVADQAPRSRSQDRPDRRS